MAKHCCDDRDHVKVQPLTLDDGRRAERHLTVDENGHEIVEIFAEEKRPLKLERRITREMKNVVAKEVHETIRDGEVVLQEVVSTEPEVPLQVRSRIGVVDHAKVVDGDYVRKDEIAKIVEDGVVAGVTALVQNMEPVAALSKAPAQPVFKAQEVVEKNVEEKKKSETLVNLIMVGIIVVQILFVGGYLWLS